MLRSVRGFGTKNIMWVKRQGVDQLYNEHHENLKLTGVLRNAVNRKLLMAINFTISLFILHLVSSYNRCLLLQLVPLEKGKEHHLGTDHEKSDGRGGSHKCFFG